ncbi:MAG: transposase [Lachnospiraceae bacterium]|nr:transposase [Lachnospiraceae bacterium]
MLLETIYKTIYQYSKYSIEENDMQKLLAIGADYCMVKNYIYQRYGGIYSLSKLYPGYTIQNEMTASGLREQLQMPAVYFYLAIFDALGDIKSEWSRVKQRILKKIKKKHDFSEEDKHYIRFVLKVNNVFTEILTNSEIQLPFEIEQQYQEVKKQVDTKKLNNYLKRNVRKQFRKLHTEQIHGFSISAKAYRYGKHGIAITTKEKRKRVFVPLTDNNSYESQLYIRLYPEKNALQIHVPIEVHCKKSNEYGNEIGLAFGMYTMLTLDNGNVYGKELGKYQIEYANWIRNQTISYNKNKQNNKGKKKYYRQKRKKEEQLHNYINRELNQFFKQETPNIIYIVKMPRPNVVGKNKTINHSVTMWQRGYIRKRLEQKCKQNAVELIEVIGKDISNVCSVCGAMGKKTSLQFICENCGQTIEIKANTARNVKQRGQKKEIIR